MFSHHLPHETKEALENIKTYLSAGNEVVQYAFTFLADLVMQNPSMMIGGIAAGSVPPNDVVTDPDGPVFPVNPGTTGPFSGSVFLNLSTG